MKYYWGISMSRRESGIELLRIVLMILIIGGHIVYTQNASLLNIGSADYYIGNIYRSFCVCAVDCFILISGYFRINLYFPKIFKIIIKTFFYVILIFIIFTLLGFHSIQITKDILLFAPIFTQRYWFLTMYVILYFLCPFLNIIIDLLNKTQKKKLMLIIIILFYIYPSISNCINAPAITKDGGYGIVNFICLYFIGTCIKEHEIDVSKKNRFLIGYIISSFLLFTMNHLLSLFFGFPFNGFINYNTIFCLSSSICLFCFFKSLKFNNKYVNKFSKVSLWVYVIHAHPIIWNLVFSLDAPFHIALHGGIYIITVLFIPIIIYFLIYIIDNLYESIFRKFESMLINMLLNSRAIKHIMEFYEFK